MTRVAALLLAHWRIIRTYRIQTILSMAGLVVGVIPLYFVGLIGTYAATQAVSIHYYGLTGGTYDHYFNLFLPPIDVLYSFLKVLVFSVILTMVCCYYGFTAKGGPAGVGVAVGRAVRLAITAVVAVGLLLDLALYGTSVSVRIAG